MRESGKSQHSVQRFLDGDPVHPATRLSLDIGFVLAKPWEETYFEYYVDLITAVASFEDPLCLDALLGAMTTGDIATRGLASLGQIVVGPVLEKLKDTNVHVRQAATIVLSELLDDKLNRHPLTSTATERVLRSLFVAASDQYPYVRMSAIQGLARVKDPKVVELLQRIAADDPYDASLHGGTEGVFPVRDLARSLLSATR